MKKIVLWGGISLLVLTLAAGLSVWISLNPARPGAEDVLRERLKGKQNFGIVVGVVDEEGSAVFGRATSGAGSEEEVNGDTVFELCSVTKVLTSLLLADSVERGEVGLDDPIDRYVPQEVRCPEKDGQKITLVHLATHTSGLPSTPRSSRPSSSGPENVPGYVGFSERDLYAFLSELVLTTKPGRHFEYSNLGMGLLGHILASRAGRSFEELIVERICEPLGMDSTRITLSPELARRLAPGHFRNGEPARHWQLGPALVGAGAMRSTVNDMLRFLSANLGLQETELTRAMEASHEWRGDTSWPEIGVGLGWLVARRGDATFLVHSGGVAGYRSFIGLSKDRGRGVVVLSNSSNDVEDIALYMLDESFAPASGSPPMINEAVKIDPQHLVPYVGEYRIGHDHLVSVFMEGERLYIQITGQPCFELHPETRARFYVRQPEALIRFAVADDGRIAELVIRQAGAEAHCPRLEREASAPVDRGILGTYVAQYEISPRLTLTVTREGDTLYVQPTNKPREEMLALSESQFRGRISDTEVSFPTEAGGPPREVRYRRAGRAELVGARIAERQSIRVGEGLLQDLVGVYEYNPDFRLEVTRVGHRLFIQGSEQPRHELFALSESRFFLKTGPAELSFARDSSGGVEMLTVHSGRETEVSRKIR